MAALRQTGSHCGGPRAGQVLPETQIPPKQFPSCLPVTSRGILRALPGKGLGPGHKGSIFPGKQRGAGCRQLPEEPVQLTHGHSRPGARCPPCCATPGGSRTLARPRLQAAGWIWPLLLQDHPQELGRSGVCLQGVAQMRARLAPRDKVCPRAEPCQALCWKSLAPSRASPPWQGPAQLGTGHSQGGGSHTEPSPGFGLRTGPRLMLTRFADGPSLLALPCARHCRSLPVPGLSSLNPFTVKSRSRPAAAPPAAAHPGRGGRERRERKRPGRHRSVQTQGQGSTSSTGRAAAG